MEVDSAVSGVPARKRKPDDWKEDLTESLLKRIAQREAKVGVVGLGYVGLPLGMTFAEAGFPVLGLEVDSRKVQGVLEGKSYIRHIPSAAVKKLRRAGTLSATVDFSRAEELDCILICVPTPLTPAREP